MKPRSEIPFQELVSALSRPSAFPGAPDGVECIQTHISAVFLVDNLAYKLKKPKDLGFLNFTRREARRHFCHEEVRLNRRLAPGVYQGVVPITRSDGEIRVLEQVSAPDARVGPEVVDWAVRMVRLPESRTLGALLAGGAIDHSDVARIARRIARFHGDAASSPEIAAVARWETVAANHRENFEQIRAFVGETITEPVLRKLRDVTERELAARRALIEARADRGVPRDTHGDLRLEHVYLLPPGSAGRDPSAGDPSEDQIVIIDCVEFNERYRWADPVSDMAFLVMELELAGHPDLAEVFTRAYFEASDDRDGVELLPLYATYRNVVRGKVRGLQAADDQLEEAARDRARRRARRHFLAGLVRLSEPRDRPAIIAVFGLPGVGKSTIAEGLASTEGFEWIDTDRVRKELVEREGADRTGRDTGEFGSGLYSAEWTARTYRACLERAEAVALDGGRALIEGSFRAERDREALIELAQRIGVPVVLLECRVGTGEARRRIETRRTGPSDADWEVHRRMRESWEPISDTARPFVRTVSLEGDVEESVRRVREMLEDEEIGGGA